MSSWSNVLTSEDGNNQSPHNLSDKQHHARHEAFFNIHPQTGVCIEVFHANPALEIDLGGPQAEGPRLREPQAQKLLAESMLDGSTLKGMLGKIPLTPGLQRRAINWSIDQKR